MAVDEKLRQSGWTIQDMKKLNLSAAPGVAICGCNDGLRPVIFKPEATNETSVIDNEPKNELEAGGLPYA